MIMMMSSNGNIFRVTDPLCGEFTGTGEFPSQRPVTRSFDVFFDLRPNKRLSKQPWGWWFQTPSWSLWRQCNDLHRLDCVTGCQYSSLKVASVRHNPFRLKTNTMMNLGERQTSKQVPYSRSLIHSATHVICQVNLITNFLSFLMSLVIVINCGERNV